jgi:hypothetical protein
VKIRTANRAGGETHDRVMWLFNRGLLHIVKTDVADAVKYNSFIP